MKIRTLLSTALLAIVALALTAPALGQYLNRPGLGVSWKIALRGETARTSGSAEYATFRAAVAPPSTANGKLTTRFTVETITPALVDGTKLDVFVGPSPTPNEPYGKLVGTIDVDGGFGSMVLVAAKVPAVQKGSTIVIVARRPTPGDDVILRGTF